MLFYSLIFYNCNSNLSGKAEAKHANHFLWQTTWKWSHPNKQSCNSSYFFHISQVFHNLPICHQFGTSQSCIIEAILINNVQKLWYIKLHHPLRSWPGKGPSGKFYIKNQSNTCVPLENLFCQASQYCVNWRSTKNCGFKLSPNHK